MLKYAVEESGESAQSCSRAFLTEVRVVFGAETITAQLTEAKKGDERTFAESTSGLKRFTLSGTE